MGQRVVTRQGYLSVRILLNKTPKKAQTPVPVIKYINWVKSTRLRSTDTRYSLHCSKTALHTTRHVWSDKSLITGHLGLLFQVGQSTSLTHKQFHTTSRWFDYDERVLNFRRDLNDIFQQVKDKKNPAERATKECKNLIKKFHENTAITTTLSEELSKRKRLMLYLIPEDRKFNRDVAEFTLKYWKQNDDVLNSEACVLAREDPEIVRAEATVERLKEANPELQDYTFDVHVFDHEKFRWIAESYMDGTIFLSKFEVNYYNDNQLASCLAHEMGHVFLQHPREGESNNMFIQESVVHSASVIQDCCAIDKNAREPISYVKEIVDTVDGLIPTISDKGRHELEADMAGCYFSYKAEYDPQDDIDQLLQSKYTNINNLPLLPPFDLLPEYDIPDDYWPTSDCLKLLKFDIKEFIDKINTSMVHPSNRERGEALQIYYDKLRNSGFQRFD